MNTKDYSNRTSKQKYVCISFIGLVEKRKFLSFAQQTSSTLENRWGCLHQTMVGGDLSFNTLKV